MHIQNVVILKGRLDPANEEGMNTNELSDRLVGAGENIVRGEVDNLLSGEDISDSDMSAVDFYLGEATKLGIDLSDIQGQITATNRRVNSDTGN